MLILRKSSTPAPNFACKKAVNLYRLPWNSAFDSNGDGAYGTFYTLSELQGLAALGFDSVRLCIPPTPLLYAQSVGDTAKLASRISALLTMGDLCIQAGLGVIFDMHFTGSTDPFKVVDVLASSDPNASLWATYRGATVALAAAISGHFDQTEVALDLFNEPFPLADSWFASILQPNVYAAVRAAAPNLTLIIRGGNYDNVPSLINLRMSDYDANSLVSVHLYQFPTFTYCGNSELGAPYNYYSNVAYPPDGVDPSAAIAAATANINADDTLTAQQKTDTIATAATLLTRYYSYQGRSRLQADVLQSVTQWADRLGIDRSRIFVGEMGVTNGASVNVPSVTSSSAWFSDMRTWADAQGVRISVFCADIPPWQNSSNALAFFLQSPSAGGGSVCNSSNVPVAIKTALGLV